MIVVKGKSEGRKVIYKRNPFKPPKKKTPKQKLKSHKVDLHMLKPMAERLHDITDDDFKEKCNKENVDITFEFIRNNRQLSPQTRDQYLRCLKQFFYYIMENAGDKPFYRISKRDFIGYLGYMQDRGLSSSAIKLRKASVSSFCNYIENIVSEDMEECRHFRNFTKGMPKINPTQTFEKIPITIDEYNKMIKYFTRLHDYLAIAVVTTLFNVGCRVAEIVQFKTEILDYPVKEGSNYILSHVVRGKGAGVEGKPLKFMIPLEVLDSWRQWIEHRGYEHEYVFTIKCGNRIRQMDKGWIEEFCKTTLSPLLYRRINPHLFKASCVTRLLEQGKDLKLISKYVAHHNDVSVTSTYYDLRTFEDELEDLFNFDDDETKE